MALPKNAIGIAVCPDRASPRRLQESWGISTDDLQARKEKVLSPSNGRVSNQATHTSPKHRPKEKEKKKKKKKEEEREKETYKDRRYSNKTIDTVKYDGIHKKYTMSRIMRD